MAKGGVRRNRRESTPDRLVRDVRQALTPPFRLAGVPEKLFLLAEVHGLAADPVVLELRATFDAALHEAGRADVLERELEYACTLASAPKTLLYEEMHKLVGLCDDIHALRSLGYHADQELIAEFEADVRARFAAERGKAHMAAQHLVQDWSRPLWWYAENLLRSARPGPPRR